MALTVSRPENIYKKSYRFSIRLIHSKNFELITRFNTEGRLELKGYELLSGHPLFYDGALEGKYFWVETNESIRAEHIDDVYCEMDKQENVLSPLEYRKYENYLKSEYPDGFLSSETYEEYLEETQKPTYLVYLSFTDDGARQLAKVTRENVNRNLAIIVGRFVVSQPVIYEELYDGIATFYSSSNKAEAETLTELIKFATQHEHSR